MCTLLKKKKTITIDIFYQVMFHNGMSNNERDFEVCLRAENVFLPKNGFFGLSAATGGLAGESLKSNLLQKNEVTRNQLAFNPIFMPYLISFGE